jgi:hypothetical protein
MRRPSNSALILAALALAGWWFTRPRAVEPLPKPAVIAPTINPTASSPAPAPMTSAPVAPVAGSTPVAADTGRSALLDQINQPSGTIQSDLRLMHEVFAAWQTNFPRGGNPVGENAEITRALTGANPLNLVLVPRDHPAINRAGELTDRWGTPFRFHQLAGDRMEIRSAGPDRRFGNEDDAVVTP